jgi:hypothetical protein
MEDFPFFGRAIAVRGNIILLDSVDPEGCFGVPLVLGQWRDFIMAAGPQGDDRLRHPESAE